jgi:hypothetical protein
VPPGSFIPRVKRTRARSAKIVGLSSTTVTTSENNVPLNSLGSAPFAASRDAMMR